MGRGAYIWQANSNLSAARVTHAIAYDPGACDEHVAGLKLVLLAVVRPQGVGGGMGRAAQPWPLREIGPHCAATDAYTPSSMSV